MFHLSKYFWFAFTIFFSSFSLVKAQVNFSLTGDLVYEQGISEESAAKEKLNIRTAEFNAYGAIDQNWDGFFSMASHNEDGENIFEVHEIFVESSKLLPRTNLKIGQYFLGIGRLNRYHRHDWEFTNAPLVHKEFLSEEALFDTGAEFNILLPTNRPIEWTFGATTGTVLGHDHSSEEHSHEDEHEGEHEEEEHSEDKDPTAYTRVSTFFDGGSGSGLELGASYLRRKEEGADVHLAGLDFTSKKRVGRIVDRLFQAEFWYQNEKENSSEEKMGFYLFAQKALGQNLFLGLRGDYYQNLSYRNDEDKKVDHIDYALTAQLTHRSSEFFHTRVSLAHTWESIDKNTMEKDTSALLQFVFFLGAHPAHNF